MQYRVCEHYVIIMLKVIKEPNFYFIVYKEPAVSDAKSKVRKGVIRNISLTYFAWFYLYRYYRKIFHFQAIKYYGIINTLIICITIDSLFFFNYYQF